MEEVGGPPNLKIESMFAYVAQDVQGEGIMASSMPINGQMMMMPLVGADIARIKALLPYAQQIALHSGRTFKIYRFDHKVDITDEIELY